MELNESFPKGMNMENAAIQCRAVVLNVNLGYNREYKVTKDKVYWKMHRNPVHRLAINLKIPMI